nr:hypothetical protein [Tanacetum cinerariifolium]
MNHFELQSYATSYDTLSDDPFENLNRGMILLANAFRQRYSTPANNRLRTSSNIGRHVYVQGETSMCKQRLMGIVVMLGKRQGMLEALCKRLQQQSTNEGEDKSTATCIMIERIKEVDTNSTSDANPSYDTDGLSEGSRCVFLTFLIVLRPFKTLCFFNYALILRQDYDITSSLRRGALQVNSIPSGFLSINAVLDPSKQENLSVNKIHGFGVSFIIGMSVARGSSPYLSTMKSVRIWPLMDVLVDLQSLQCKADEVDCHWLRVSSANNTMLIAFLAADSYIISTSLGLGAVNMGNSAIRCFISLSACSAWDPLEIALLYASLQGFEKRQRFFYRIWGVYGVV